MTPRIQGRYISEEEGARIVQLRHKRLSMREIGAATGRSPTSVRRYLARQIGITPKAPLKPKPHTLPLIRKARHWARQGLDMPAAAEKMGISAHQLRNIVLRYNLLELEQLIPVSEVAADAGTSSQRVRELIHAGELAHSTFFTRYAFTAEQADDARRYFAQHYRTPAQVAGWFSSTQVAREMNATLQQVHHWFQQRSPVVAGIERARVIGMTGNVWRYNPDQTHAAARRRNRIAQPLEVPGNALDVQQVSRILHRSESTIHYWARLKGAPVHKTAAKGSHYYHPEELLTWLKGYNLRLAHRLRSHLLQQQRAA